MDRAEGESPEGIGSVKAAISLYGGERIHGKKKKKKTDSPSKAGELHLAQLDIGRLNEGKNFAEKEKARAESELHKAKSAAKELASQIEQSNVKARARKPELRSMSKPETNDLQYEELMKELGNLKQELGRLKLDVESALGAKAKAEKEIEASNSKAKSYLRTAEELSREIEEANEEHVIVEIARIEAEREFKDIEDQTRVEATRFSETMEEAKEKIKNLHREINHSKELEMKLAITNLDLNVLQNEMESVRAMERSFKKSNPESENSSLLESAKAELEAAKKELATVKEEGFHFMTSMDVVRKELAYIGKETEILKKQEQKVDSAIQHLNSKLLKAKSKLESALMADERAKAIVSNLSAALQELQREIEAAKKEKKMIIEETNSIRSKIETTDSEISSAEEKLQAAIQDLEAVKKSEAILIKKLRSVTERTMKNRASTSVHSSTMTISKCEYDYLSKRAASAELVADKKVAAAQAWIEALKAEEKEILMKTELAEKEIKEIRDGEERENYKIEKALVAQRTIEEELRDHKKNEEEEEEFLNLQLAIVTPPATKSRRENGVPAAGRRAKLRRSSASSGTRNTARSPSFTVRKRRKVMPNLVKFLRDRSIGKMK